MMCTERVLLLQVGILLIPRLFSHKGLLCVYNAVITFGQSCTLEVRMSKPKATNHEPRLVSKRTKPVPVCHSSQSVF
eukprot:3120493-Amphidinium_carterae.2